MRNWGVQGAGLAGNDGMVTQGSRKSAAVVPASTCSIAAVNKENANNETLLLLVQQPRMRIMTSTLMTMVWLITVQGTAPHAFATPNRSVSSIH